MVYLGLDVEAARELSAQLRRASLSTQDSRRVIDTATMLSGLNWGDPAGLLDEVEGDLRVVAIQIEHAADQVESYQFARPTYSSFLAPRAPRPDSTSVPRSLPEPSVSGQPVMGQGFRALPQWNAHATMPWNQVRQESSHNTFAVMGGISAQYLHGVRSFELDIHRGAATDFAPRAGWIPFGSPLLAVAWDAARHDRGVDHDWHIFHTSIDPHSEYTLLSEGLRVAAALDRGDPITLFIDAKDVFGGEQSGAALDHLVRTELGDRLYSPSDILARAPGASSLHQAISVAGWPTVAELDGRIIVVMTGEIDSYSSDNPALFVAPAPVILTTRQGPEHVPAPNVLFYNMEFDGREDDRLRAIQAGGNIVRTYFNPRCGYLAPDGLHSLANYRAADLDAARDFPCLAAVPYPPEGTPVPN